MADLCSHCLETEAALAERDREIERLRGALAVPNHLVENLRESARNTIPLVQANVAQSLWVIPLELCSAANEIERLRAREAKWHRLIELLESAYERAMNPTELSQLRRELGLDGEGQT